MQQLLSRLNIVFERLPNAILPYRWFCLLAFVLMSALMATGIARHFAINMAPEVWFQDNALPLKIRDQFRKEFGSDEGIYIVYRHQSGDVFSEDALRTLIQLHQEIEQASLAPEPNELSQIIQVDSLYNARYQIAEGDTLISKKLIGAEFPETGADREQRRAIALTQDSFDRVFYSRDFQYSGIRLKTSFGAVPIDTGLEASLDDTDDLLQDDAFGFDLDSSGALNVDESAEVTEVQYARVQIDDYYRFMQALRAITEQADYQDMEFHFVGNPVTMEFVLDSIFEASGLLMLMVAIVVVLLWTLFRSLSAVVWPLMIVIFAGFWAMGMGCWLGMTYTSMLVLSFMLVLAVGIASCVHVLSAYTLFSREGKTHQRAMALAYRKTGIPILLTTITTMAGMFALTLTDMPIITVFGMSSAMAVGFAFVLIFGLLPVLMNVWHPRLSKETLDDPEGKKPLIDLQPLLSWIAGFTERRAKTIVMSYAAIFAVLIIGSLDLQVDSNISKLARQGSPLQVAMELVDNDLMGGMSLEVHLTFDQADALKDPEVLQAISDWQEHIAANYSDKVIKTLSLADIVEDTNQVMHNNAPEFHRVPDDPQLTAQLLYLFNNANPADRRDLVTDDYRQTRITFLMRNAGTYEYTNFFDLLEEDVVHFLDPLKTSHPGMVAQLTGTFHLLMELMDHIAWTQLKSFSFAMIIITLIMMLTLGSLQAGLISMIPNLLPAVFTFGLMGGLGVPLDMDTLIVAPIIIGIAVDDTIHFLTHYRYSWIEHGDVGIAVRQTLREVGQAVTFTSFILGLGFAVLAFASYLGLAKPGLFGSLAIMVALLSDLLFLPALMHWLKPDLGRKKIFKQSVALQSTNP